MFKIIKDMQIKVSIIVACIHLVFSLILFTSIELYKLFASDLVKEAIAEGGYLPDILLRLLHILAILDYPVFWFMEISKFRSNSAMLNQIPVIMLGTCQWLVIGFIVVNIINKIRTRVLK